MTEVLGIEDDEAISDLLRRGLTYEGYRVSVAQDGNSGLLMARDAPPDIVVLDLMLPGLDGLEVCRRLRAADDVPILILTARGTVSDRISGLDSGADDYMVKPFSIDELLARVRALLRRRAEPEDSDLRFADVVMDTKAHEVRRGSRLLHLTAKQYDLLEFFLRHARGEYRADESADAEFFTTGMRLLERSSYSHYETSNYALPGHESIHNRAYWRGADYLGIGPSAFSTIGFERRQNVADYRAYTDRVLAGDSPIQAHEQLTLEMKRAERIALSLRTRAGVPAQDVSGRPNKCREFVELGLLHDTGSHFVLTEKGKLLADSVAEAFV